MGEVPTDWTAGIRLGGSRNWPSDVTVRWLHQEREAPARPVEIFPEAHRRALYAAAWDQARHVLAAARRVALGGMFGCKDWSRFSLAITGCGGTQARAVRGIMTR